LAVEGQAGVEAVFTELRDELARAMALCGSRTIGEIDRSLVVATRD
jgi:isopentenyl diphosphate isomerase/L-lactate dehydrogenase-like FMN-dependent dehydrogenase